MGKVKCFHFLDVTSVNWDFILKHEQFKEKMEAESAFLKVPFNQGNKISWQLELFHSYSFPPFNMIINLFRLHAYQIVWMNEKHFLPLLLFKLDYCYPSFECFID